MITQTDLERLKNGLDTLENIDSKYRLFKLREEAPFSRQLNNFISQWYAENWEHFLFTDEDDFDENDIQGTFDRHVQRFKETGTIKIWTGASDGTIFGEPTINHYFRAWHDYIHITEGLGYDFVGESIVCEIQKSQLPSTWIFEKELIQSEIVGQAQYFMTNGEFLSNQRLFTEVYLNDPLRAIRSKQQ